MLAASFWSLLTPAIQRAEENFEDLKFIPVIIGFLLGNLLIMAYTMELQHLQQHFIRSTFLLWY